MLSLAGQVSSLPLVAELFLCFTCAAKLEKKVSSFKIEIMAGEPVVLASVRQQVPGAAFGNGLIICKAKLQVELPRKALLQPGLMSSSLYLESLL